jgi:spermidine synthase
MTSYAHSSEDAMLSLACPKPPANACVLVGGLGMGYTAAAALALMPRRGKVVVAEIMPEVVEWNRGLLGPLAGHPLDDPRTELVLGDVANVIRGSESRFDAILLDVDNSVDSFSLAHNVWLYTTAGLEAAHRALRPGGTLAIWSVGTDATFERMLRKHGFTASTHPIRERNKRGGHFSVLLGRRD